MTYSRIKIILLMITILSYPANSFADVNVLRNQELSGISNKEGTVLTVSLAPGESSQAHRHNAHTFVYILEGSVIMQVEGGKRVTLKPGDTFYESPSDIHKVSQNASSTLPAKFLVFFVKDKGTPILIPAN